MATWYSDVFSSSASASAPEAGYMVAAGRQSYPKMISQFVIPTTVADNDVIVMQPVDPRDRLLSLVVSTLGTLDAATSVTLDFGLYKLKADRTLGAVLDLNLFATLVDVDTTAIAHADLFTEAATLNHSHRGKRIWELYNVGPGSLTVGPAETWAICAQANITGAVSVADTLTMETELVNG